MVKIPESLMKTAPVLQLLGHPATRAANAADAMETLWSVRKRPATSEPAHDGVVHKRPRTADSSAQAAPRLGGVPGTPRSSKAAGTSLLASSRTPQQPQTPADATTTTTPGEAPGSAERPTTNGSSGATHPRAAALSAAAAARGDDHHVELGKSLKRRRDRIVAEHPNPTERFKKLVACVSLECVIAYLYGFRKQTHHLPTLIQLVHSRLQDFGQYPVLRTIVWQLLGVCHEMLIMGTAQLREDRLPPSAKMSLIEKQRYNTWRQSHQEVMQLAKLDPRESMHMSAVGPWTRPEEAAREALGVLLLWAGEEQVEWEPKLAMDTLAAH